MSSPPSAELPTVIVINGTSSSGKTSTAREMQRFAQRPLMRIGIDDLFASCPEQWGGGAAGPLSSQGFRYEAQPDGSTRIVAGPAGEAMLRGYHRAVAGYATAGLDVVVDDMFLTPDCYPDWQEALTGIRQVWVALTCPLDVLDEREARRGQRPGLARGHAGIVHHGVAYDLELNSATANVETRARAILARASVARNV